jgi:rfaE bifunctional protein kinase chain/domain
MRKTMDETKKDYSRKIKSREELREVIGGRPRSKSVIMCHGTFDLVHPGHIRHFMHAKKSADLLVVSLTSDSHIAKANYRPYVPQQLRAMNLAMLEVVDFVIIDDNPTPLENIEFLQPDYFAKGYEYTDGGVHPKTQEEMDVLATYGGEVVFTPGDVVFSSSAFIDQAPPDLSHEKLMVLMESEGVSFDDLRALIKTFKDLRVHIVGDTIVDSYSYCTTISSGMAKTPTLSLKHERQTDFVGGAAIVAKHIRKAGAGVVFTTVFGDDPLKDFVLEDLNAQDIVCDYVVDPTRPTTQKHVFIAGTYRVLKVDKVENTEVSEKIQNYFKTSISSDKQSDAFVFSDFRHGIFSHRTIPIFTQSLPEGPVRVADSQVASRWGNICEFQGFDLITPNEREARFALGDQDSVIRPLALSLYKRAKCKNLILKLRDRGVITYRKPDSDVRSFFTMDSFANHVVDPVGAGDALLAYSTLAMTANRSPVMASILGSIAAAIACEHEGNIAVSPEDVLEKLESIENRVNYV